MEIICYDSDGEVLEYFTQWDSNRVIEIHGTELNIAPEIHFYNSKSSLAIVVQSTLESGIITAVVPNILLQDCVTIYASIYAQLSDSVEKPECKTIYTIKVPVRPRKKPSDYAYHENIIYRDLSLITENILSRLSAIELELGITADSSDNADSNENESG